MYKVIIKGVPEIEEGQLHRELSQHGRIESLELTGEIATIAVTDRDVADGIHTDYNGRYLRGKPVTAELILPN